MAKKESEMLPIGDGLDVYEREDKGGRRVRIDLSHLPDCIDPNSLVVDIRRLFTLMRVVGIASLDVMTTDDRSDNASVPMIVGFDANGQAVGGRAKGSTYRPDVDIDRGETGLLKNKIAEIRVRIKLNVDDIVAAISQKNEKSSSVDVWSKMVDDNLKCALKYAGLGYLLNFNNRDVSAFLTAIFAYFLVSKPSTINIHVIVVSLSALVCSQNFRLLDKLIGKKDERASVLSILGVEFDRAIILLLMLRSRRLISSVCPYEIKE